MKLAERTINSRPESPRPPKLTPGLQRVEAERAAELNGRFVLERASMQRGLLLLAVLALAVSAWRAGLDRCFIPGWWRLW